MSKTIKTKVILKHDTEANWNSSTYKPAKGELIIYDTDNTCSYVRFKIGNGSNTVVKDLPFCINPFIITTNGTGDVVSSIEQNGNTLTLNKENNYYTESEINQKFEEVNSTLQNKAANQLSSTSSNGLMSKEDKAKLDGIKIEATNDTFKIFI